MQPLESRNSLSKYMVTPDFFSSQNMVIFTQIFAEKPFVQ